MSQLATRTHRRGPHRGTRFAPLLTGFALGLLLVAGDASASEQGLMSRFRAPSFATSTLTPSTHRDKAPCGQPECVGRKLDALSTVRLTGEFGSFIGRVARWSADSLSGFMSDPDWGGSAPPAPLGWVQIQQVDKRVSNSGHGAVIGGLALGTLTALFAFAIDYAAHEPVTVFSIEEHNYTRAALIGGGIGAVVGAGLGAAIGSTSNRWAPIYQRP